MNKKIIAIGGHVIKTALDELRTVIEQDKVEMLIHNGGSIFHDFQRASDPTLESHSYPIDDLLNDYSCNEPASELIWNWITKENGAPKGSITKLCEDKNIPVLLFTAHACDFWQLFAGPFGWAELGFKAHNYYQTLVKRFEKPFHYLCMGSAVIHPEVFIKAIADSKAKDFTADVVDFKYMYRPKTRVAKYGTYHIMTHKEYLNIWITK
jgi:hypothetical protein